MALFQRSETKLASEAQIRKLLAMLGSDGFIRNKWDKGNREWEYDLEGAITWVNDSMGFFVIKLEELSQTQMSACYRALEDGGR